MTEEILESGEGISIPIEEFFEDGTVILAGDPMPDITIDEMREIVDHISSIQDLVDAYATTNNKFFYIEDDLYDYEVDTPEYKQIRAVVDAWAKLFKELHQQVMKASADEELLLERQPNSGYVVQIAPFMEKYGYRDGRGWWVKKK